MALAGAAGAARENRGAEAVEPRERVGSAVERVVVCEGVVERIGSRTLSVQGARHGAAIGVDASVTDYGDGVDPVAKYEGQRVRVVMEIVGEGGSVHSESVSPAATTREAHS